MRRCPRSSRRQGTPTNILARNHDIRAFLLLPSRLAAGRGFCQVFKVSGGVERGLETQSDTQRESQRLRLGRGSVRPAHCHGLGAMPTIRRHAASTMSARPAHAFKHKIGSLRFCATSQLRNFAGPAYGVPASYLALAGRVYIAPVTGSAHGHGLLPKNAGFAVRYMEFGMAKPPGVLCQRWEFVRKS